MNKVILHLNLSSSVCLVLLRRPLEDNDQPTVGRLTTLIKELGTLIAYIINWDLVLDTIRKRTRMVLVSYRRKIQVEAQEEKKEEVLFTV